MLLCPPSLGERALLHWLRKTVKYLNIYVKTWFRDVINSLHCVMAQEWLEIEPLLENHLKMANK